MIYFDASALITLVGGRPYAEELDRFLAHHPDAGGATSTVGLVETVRALDRMGGFPDVMHWLSSDYTEVLLTEEIRDAAAALAGRLRTLDAIHVASAQAIGEELVALVSYDKKMIEVARGVGLPVGAPGME